MADDMGWGETGYRNHPVLETPNLDAMAAAGLRFERFYVGGPVCSPTRASVLTGRTHDRKGVLTHGYALRAQEKTVAEVLRAAGYVTGHFGKWHLSGLSGPGAPILASDPRHPGRFGFDEWASTSNFFDIGPLVSCAGKIEAATGDSSEIVVAIAIEFLERHCGGGQPLFDASFAGKDYPEGRVDPPDPKPVNWSTVSEYQPFLNEWRKRWVPSSTGPTRNPNYSEMGLPSYPPSEGVFAHRHDGAGNKDIRMGQVTDGLSKTFAVVERALRAQAPIYLGAVWPGRLNGSNAAMIGRASWPPNTPHPGGSDPGCTRHTWSSEHPGGVNACFCDGSVRFLSEDIDSRTGFTCAQSELLKLDTSRLYQRLFIRNDGKQIDAF